MPLCHTALSDLLRVLQFPTAMASDGGIDMGIDNFHGDIDNDDIDDDHIDLDFFYWYWYLYDCDDIDIVIDINVDVDDGADNDEVVDVSLLSSS